MLVTVTLEPVKKAGIERELNHNLRIGKQPNYVKSERIKDNLVIGSVTKEQVISEFESRLETKNKVADELREKIRIYKKELKKDGVSTSERKRLALEKFGKPQNKVKREDYQNIMIRGLIGFDDDLQEKLIQLDWTKDKFNKQFQAVMRKVCKICEIDSKELNHFTVHWDESKPHAHFGFQALQKDQSGKYNTFTEKMSPSFLSKLQQEVNKAFKFKPAKTYKDRRKDGEKVPKHKSTKELKIESSLLTDKERERKEELKKTSELISEKKADLAKVESEAREVNARLESRQKEIIKDEEALELRKKDLNKRETRIVSLESEKEDLESQIQNKKTELQELQENVVSIEDGAKQVAFAFIGEDKVKKIEKSNPAQFKAEGETYLSRAQTYLEKAQNDENISEGKFKTLILGLKKIFRIGARKGDRSKAKKPGFDL